MINSLITNWIYFVSRISTHKSEDLIMTLSLNTLLNIEYILRILIHFILKLKILFSPMWHCWMINKDKEISFRPCIRLETRSGEANSLCTFPGVHVESIILKWVHPWPNQSASKWFHSCHTHIPATMVSKNKQENYIWCTLQQLDTFSSSRM